MHAANATVSIRATDPLASEGDPSDLGAYTLWRVGGNLTQPLTVNYAMTGSTAVRDTDYTLAGPSLTTSTVTFPANQAEITVILTALDDTQQDGNEYATFQIQNGTGYVPGSPNLASIAIGDTDGAFNSVAVVATDPVAVEPVLSGWPGSPAVCTFHRAGNVQDPLTIHYGCHGPAAGGDTTWTPAPLFYITFPAGAYTTVLTITPTYDGLTEGAEITGPGVSPAAPPATGNYFTPPQGLGTVDVTIYDFPANISYTLKTVEGSYSYPDNLSVPYGLNNAGAVVGAYLPYSPYPYATTYGFCWSGRFTESGQFTQIGPIIPGYGLNSLTAGINLQGQVVGCSDYTYIAGGENVPIFWENGTFTLLMAPSGWMSYGDNLTGNSINDSGLIVGTMVNPQGTFRAVKWAGENTQGVDLGQMAVAPDPYLAGFGLADSPSGRIVGKAQLVSGVFHAFRTRAADQDLLGPLSDLGSLAGPDGTSEAWAINSRDEVAGATQISGGQWRAFVIRSGGGMVALSPVAGGSWSKAYGINGSGYLVGQSTNYWGYSKATLWNHNGVVFTLESQLSGGLPSGWTELTSAEAINDDGQIAGWGYKNGVQKAFLLTPVR